MLNIKVELVSIQTRFKKGKISRWYNVEVVCKGAISYETFTGIVSRSSNVTEVLRYLADGGVKFTIEGKKIVVQF